MPMSNNEEKVDYISKLPTTILSFILSSFTTQNAVQTSILSKRWRYVWTEVPVIDFHQFPMCQLSSESREERKMYNDFVGRVVHRNTVTCLKHFTIQFLIHDVESLDAMKSWLDVLRWRQYCELNMKLLGDFAPLRLHKEFLFSQKLVVLDLNGFCIDDSQESFHLPNLESVHFGNNIVFPSDHFLKRFLLGCPVLKSLYIYVESSSLVSLEIRSLERKKNPESDIRIIIQASNLRNLILYDAYAHYDIIGDLNLLTEANIRFLPSDTYDGLDDNVVQLIEKVSWTRTLVLGIPNLTRFTGVLPKYENLTHLKLMDYGSAYELLKRAPKLKSLTLNNGEGQGLGPFSYCAYFSCLEKVELLLCLFSEHDTNVAKYFLKNGSALKEMIVNVYSFTTSQIERCRVLHQVLRDAPAFSPICQVKVLSHRGGSCIDVT